jgi:Ferric iron reductase FhuF-like transporter
VTARTAERPRPLRELMSPAIGLTADFPASGAHPLHPVLASVASVASRAPLATLHPDDHAIWFPGASLTDPDGPAVERLLEDAARRWRLGPHAAAALAFKSYAWAATLPVVVGWVLHRRVPLLETANLRLGIADARPYVRFDLADATVAVLGDDPVAAHPSACAVDDSDALLGAARTALIHDHLAGVVGALHRATRVGERLLWGSVAESIAQSVLILPAGAVADAADTARHLVGAFGGRLAELVEIVDDPARPRVRRRTCCLLFTGADGRGAYCASCCVTPR